MTNPLLKGLRPTHPGEILREDILPALRLPKARFAAILRISRQHLYDILNEAKPISVPMAMRIGKATGTSPDMWLRMQASYDLATQPEEIVQELKQIPVLQAA